MISSYGIKNKREHITRNFHVHTISKKWFSVIRNVILNTFEKGQQHVTEILSSNLLLSRYDIMTKKGNIIIVIVEKLRHGQNSLLNS